MIIICLAPHTDDGEIGMGGSINKFIEEGNEVYYIAFSTAEKSLPQRFSKDSTRKEVVKATGILGIKPDNLVILNFEVRTFSKYRQEILEIMIEMNKKIKPDIVFLPSSTDTHQDHSTIQEEGFRAFKKCSILGYEVPWNNLNFTTNSFIFLKKENIQKKIDSLSCYLSQKVKNNNGLEIIKPLAKVRGLQIGTEYAEAFEVIRWIIK